jgi:hypothetical protein
LTAGGTEFTPGRAACAFVLSLAMASLANAQAWVPRAGTGSITLAVQRIDQTGHRVSDGTLFVDGRSLNMSVFVEILYSVTDRLVVSGALPYVFGRYTDPAPPPPFLPFLPIDQCRCWHSGAQDFVFTGRYNLANGALGLTPSVSVVLPSHDYEYRGEAALGRNLRELRVAIDAGRRLDVITDRLSVDSHYSYAVVEQVLDIPNNRSNASIGMSFKVRRRLSTHGMLAWQRTHGGLRIGAPPPYELQPPGDVNTQERLEQHDRVLRDNSWHAEATVNYEFPRFDLFASYRAFLGGTDTHAGRALTTGISWPFETRP